MIFAKKAKNVLVTAVQCLALAPILPVVALMWCFGLLDENQIWSISLFGQK